MTFLEPEHRPQSLRRGQRPLQQLSSRVPCCLWKIELGWQSNLSTLMAVGPLDKIANRRPHLLERIARRRRSIALSGQANTYYHLRHVRHLTLLSRLVLTFPALEMSVLHSARTLGLHVLAKWKIRRAHKMCMRTSHRTAWIQPKAFVHGTSK